MSPAALRRTVHASTALILLAVPLGSWTILRAATAGVALLAMAVDTIRVQRPAAATWLAARVPVFRANEDGRWSGATWLWIAFAAVAWLPPPAGAGAILVTALADPAAATAGGALDVPGKTWLGSGAHWIVGSAALLALGWTVPVALGAAAVGSVLERWPGPLNDNLAAPLGVGLALVALA